VISLVDYFIDEYEENFYIVTELGMRSLYDKMKEDREAGNLMSGLEFLSIVR
jgi:hypothetical protein